MADFYYRAKNVGTGTTLLLNDAYIGSVNPVTSGLHRRFKAEDFSNNVWKDSVTGTTVSTTGTVTKVSRSGDKQFRTKNVIQFDTTGKVTFNNSSFTLYTLFTVTRYSGTSKHRIITNTTAGTNFLSGHHSGNAGVAHHNSWITSPLIDLHGSSFFIGTDTATTYSTNGILRDTDTPLSYSIPVLNINTTSQEESHGQVLDLLIYNRELSEHEKKKVEHYLASHYGLLDLSGCLTASYSRAPLETEHYLLVSNADNHITYPSFNIAQTGLTFALWFNIAPNNNWVRIFDFGNGNNINNILLYTYGTGIGVFTIDSGACHLTQVYTGCNDNTWRHLIWTISADGLTWKFYINKVLVANINSSNYGSYTNQTSVAPSHPSSVLRTSNFIGKSSFSGETNNKLNGSVDDFQMYNYPLEQSAINKTWNMDTGDTLIPKYFREKLVSESSMLVSSTTNPNWIIYPSFNIAQTGLTFALWFKSDNSLSYSRLFDLGNGTNLDNIICFMFGNDLGFSIYNASNQFFQLTNVITGCNNNVWTHFVWTISADGLTYRFYINKALRATITSATGYNSAGNVSSPFHPASKLRSSNYIAKSNWSTDDTLNRFLNGSIHTFQMWNRPLSQTEISALYTDLAFSGTYTLSQFPSFQKRFGDPPFTLANPVSTGSGGFTFTSSNTSVATIVDNVVTLVGVGTTTITALQWTETITATLTIHPSISESPVLTTTTLTHFETVVNGSAYDLVDVIQNNTQKTVNLTRDGDIQTIGFETTLNVYKKNMTCNMNGLSQGGDTQVSFGKSKKKMWVMGGNTTHSLAYSYDGINWTGLGTTLMTEVVGVVFNGTLWVAVGTKTLIPYVANSYDGINWTSKACPIFTSNIHDVAWNGKMFVVVGSGTNSIGYSYNGIDWYAVSGSIPNILTTFGRDVAWNGKMWIAVGGTGTYRYAYSYDGVQWFPIVTDALGGGLFGVTYDGTKWLAAGVGPYNFIADSVDGINWVGRGKAFFTTECHGIASNGIVTVAVGTGGSTICYTYGNNIWIPVTTPYITSARRIKWNGTMFIVVSVASPQIAYSYDGITWYPKVAVMGVGICIHHNNTLENQIVFKQRLYVSTPQLSYSYDGFTWKGLGTSIINNGCNDVLYNGTLWVAVGGNDVQQATGKNTIAYSYDGINWTGLGNTVITDWCNCVAYNGTQWLVGGYGGTVANGPIRQIAKSNTGTFFERVAAPFSDSCCGFAWNGKLWVAVGYWDNTIAWSTDGTNWTLVPNPPLTNYGLDVKWNGQMFVACGQGINHTLCWSNDGKLWNEGATSTGEITSMLSPRFISVEWNGKMWIALGGSPVQTAGTGNLAYSYDGKRWSRVNISFTQVSSITWGHGVLWDGKKWLVGTNTNMLYSYDGFTWSYVGNMVARSIAYNGLEPDTAIYMSQPTIAVGVTNTNMSKVIAYSEDGFTWTNAVQSHLTQGYVVAWNGTMWIVGGTGTTHTMIYSWDGITWNPIPKSKSIFSNNVHGLAWNGTIWVAGGAGTKTLAYSYDGLSWFPVSNTFTQVYAICWNGSMFMASVDGTSAFAYSYDGKTWVYVSSPLTSGYAIAYNKLWIGSGLGTQDSMAYSYDGKTWNGLGKTLFSTSSNAIASNGFMWVAGGEGTNSLAYSYDGIAWTGIGASLFSICYFVQWNGKRWIAAGSGTNSLAYSVDGKNWIGLGKSALDIGFGMYSQTDSKVVTDSLSFSVDTYQAGYKNLAIGVKGTLY